MKYISQKLYATTFFLLIFTSGALFAGPEKYDHLGQYKLQNVKKPGPVEEVVTEAQNKTLARASYHYNKKNQIIKVEYFKESGSDGRSLYIYDENGLIEERLVNADGGLVERVLYKHDKKKNITSYSVYDQKNEKLLTWKFKYDKGRLVTGVRFSEKEITERFERVYRGDNIITTLFSSNNEVAGTIKATLKNGQITQRTKKDLTGNYRIEYTYDKKGRLRQMSFFQNRGQGEKKLKTHHFNYTSGNAMTQKSKAILQSAMRHASLHEFDRAHPAQR